MTHSSLPYSPLLESSLFHTFSKRADLVDIPGRRRGKAGFRKISESEAYRTKILWEENVHWAPYNVQRRDLLSLHPLINATRYYFHLVDEEKEAHRGWVTCLKHPRVWSLGWEDPLEKEIATHSSILAWRILWSLVSYNPWGLKELDTTEQLTHTHTHTHTHTLGHSFLTISLALRITPNDLFWPVFYVSSF